MKILIDHSGYHLLNLGDSAMLQATVLRLKSMWPEARLEVFTYFPEKLAALCPGTYPVGSDFLRNRFISCLPRKIRFALIQFYKILLPRFYPLRASNKREKSQHIIVESNEISLPKAISEADLVVAAGGGYITDTFFLHGIGVLSILSMAVRLKMPVALFGQGIGPIKSRILQSDAKAVLPQVDIIGLREGKSGLGILKSFGVPSDKVIVTGDDTIKLAYEARPEKLGTALGINLRNSYYSNVDSVVITNLKSAIESVLTRYKPPVLPIPISLYENDADMKSIQTILPESYPPINFNQEIVFPIDIIHEIGRCRIVITGSYHGAVFALAQGIPVICLTNSLYYDYKFTGLKDLYENHCFIVSMSDPDFKQKLNSEVDQAWDEAEIKRPYALKISSELIDKNNQAYERFFDLVKSKISKNPNYAN